jgi:quercetin dioxygenase-like cupin family protein
VDVRAAGSIEWRRGETEHFQGEVWLGALSPTEAGDGVKVIAVQFGVGARTGWHSHPEGQVLHVISGSGVVVDESGETARIGPGDTLTAPAGRLHWHGSGGDSPMMHLSITTGGDTVWNGEFPSPA